jgi:hypothetical protein
VVGIHLDIVEGTHLAVAEGSSLEYRHNFEEVYYIRYIRRWYWGRKNTNPVGIGRELRLNMQTVFTLEFVQGR